MSSTEPCKAIICISGEAWSCDLDAPHPPLAHGNREAQALWCSHDEAVEAIEAKAAATP